MGLRINTNIASIAAQRSLNQTYSKTEGALKQLSTGNRFADLREGAGDFAIAEHLRGQVKAMESAKNNAENANSFVQVAEGGLNEQSNILIRLRELAIQASSDTFGDDERKLINVEFQQLRQEFDRIAQTTSFGKTKVLNGDDNEYVFQVGAYNTENDRIHYRSNTNTTSSEMDLNGLAISDRDDANDSLETLDGAIEKIGAARANFAAMQSRLDSVTNNAAVQIENLSAAHSRMADTDIAKAVSEVVKGQALQSYQMQVLNYANQQPGAALRLIG